jgi:hypothetical protein
VQCIPFDPAWRESTEQLQAKYERLQGSVLADGQPEPRHHTDQDT